MSKNKLGSKSKEGPDAVKKKNDTRSKRKNALAVKSTGQIALERDSMQKMRGLCRINKLARKRDTARANKKEQLKAKYKVTEK